MRRPLVVGAALGLVAAGVASVPAAAATLPVLDYGVPYANVASGVTNPATEPYTDGPLLSIDYTSLIHQNPNGTLGPGLALSWQFLNGHKVFEMTLRQGVHFSDGELVNAAAVAGYLEYYYKADNSFSGSLGNNPQFQAIGQWTVKVTLETPNPSVPYLFDEDLGWGFVAAPKAVADPNLMKTGSYGAGPYMLDYAESVPGDHWTFVPNPYYYNKSAIKYSEIYVKAFTDSASELEGQEAGQINIQWNLDTSTAAAAASAGLQVVSAPFAVYYFQLNPKATPAIANVQVRQAMNYALDRKAMTTALFGKYGVPSSEAMITGDADPGLENYYSYDPAKAKSLLAAAGYPNGFSTTIGTEAGGVSQNMAELVAQYLDAVGIKATVDAYPATSFSADVHEGKNGAFYQGAGTGATTTTLYPIFVGPSNNNRAIEVVDPEVDSLYNAGLTASNPTKDWKEMWALTTTQAYFLPVAASSEFLYVSKNSVGGTQLTPQNPWPNPAEWYPTSS